MDDKISVWVHEQSMVRADRINKRLWALCVMLICILLGTNIAWLLYESQYETRQTETTTVTQDVAGDGDVVVSGGDMDYGK